MIISNDCECTITCLFIFQLEFIEYIVTRRKEKCNMKMKLALKVFVRLLYIVFSLIFIMIQFRTV